VPDESNAAHIEELVAAEHELRTSEETDSHDAEALGEDRRRLERVSVELDRCWDLLRRRRAQRDAGGDPALVEARDEKTVEGYLG
jgi:hypothetical protein